MKIAILSIQIFTSVGSRLPRSINATNNNATNNIGIKIIYDKDESVWSEIINAIVYAAKNADSIKISQRRDTVLSKRHVLLNRKEIAKFLRISLVTLTNWTKRGLPSHCQGGRVYFDKKEVLDYMKEKS